MGESICACLVPFVDAEVPTIKSLTDYLLSQGLAKYKLPEKIYILKKLPRNPMGKIMRAELEKIVNS
jgi:2,3-dihydroxybenzoate-AMP ligase